MEDETPMGMAIALAVKKATGAEKSRIAGDRSHSGGGGGGGGIEREGEREGGGGSRVGRREDSTPSLNRNESHLSEWSGHSEFEEDEEDLQPEGLGSGEPSSAVAPLVGRIGAMGRI